MNLYAICLDPVDPVRPEDITFMDVKLDSVIIQWTVAYISYSPETYVVQYGTSRDSLIHNSRSTDSEEGEMMSYSVELSGLKDNTTYYVQVLATNTAQRSNRSCVLGFITLPLTDQSGLVCVNMAGLGLYISEGGFVVFLFCRTQCMSDTTVYFVLVNAYTADNGQLSPY